MRNVPKRATYSAIPTLYIMNDSIPVAFRPRSSSAVTHRTARRSGSGTAPPPIPMTPSAPIPATPGTTEGGWENEGGATRATRAPMPRAAGQTLHRLAG